MLMKKPFPALLSKLHIPHEILLKIQTGQAKAPHPKPLNMAVPQTAN